LYVDAEQLLLDKALRDRCFLLRLLHFAEGPVGRIVAPATQSVVDRLCQRQDCVHSVVGERVAGGDEGDRREDLRGR